MKLWTVRLRDEEGAIYTYIYRAKDFYQARSDARDLADGFQYSVVEVEDANEYVQGDVYELVSP